MKTKCKGNGNKSEGREVLEVRLVLTEEDGSSAEITVGEYVEWVFVVVVVVLRVGDWMTRKGTFVTAC